MPPEGKIRILYIITNCRKTGPTQQLLNIISNLDLSAFEPRLVTIYRENENGPSMIEEYRKVITPEVVEVSKKDILSGKTKSIRDLISSWNPDIIHTSGVFPDYMISRMRYENHVLTSRNYVYEDYPAKHGKLKGTMLAWIHLYAIKHTKYARACSKTLTDLYSERLKINLPFIRNGVNTSKFPKVNYSDRFDYRKKLGIPQEGTYLVYGGGFNDRKDQRFLLQALTGENKIPDVNLLLLGDGPHFNELYNEFGSYENVYMPGSVSNMYDYLAAADYYVSVSKSEGLPNGVLEAMSVGLPVLLSDIPQHKEIMSASTNTGLLYELGNGNDFMNKLQELLSSNREDMSLNGIDCVQKNFTSQIMSKNYQNLYYEIMR